MILVFCSFACVCFVTGAKLEVFVESWCVAEDLQRRSDTFSCYFLFAGDGEKKTQLTVQLAWCEAFY